MEKINSTFYDVKRIRNHVNDRKIDLKYLTSYLGWKHKEETKAEKLAHSIDEKVIQFSDANEKGLDEIVNVKSVMDKTLQKYKIDLEVFSNSNKAEINAMMSQKHKLEDILGEGHYVDSYSLMREMIRKYLLVNYP